MILQIHTNKEVITINTSSSITVKDLITQLEEGNLVLIETINHSTYIINCMNINAIEILNNINIPPIQE